MAFVFLSLNLDFSVRKGRAFNYFSIFFFTDGPERGLKCTIKCLSGTKKSSRKGKFPEA